MCIESKTKLTGIQGWLLLLILPFAIVWSAYVLTILWGWFAVTAFGLPVLSIAQAAGLSLLVTYYRNSRVEDKTFDETIGAWVITPLMYLGLGWVIKLFI